MFADPADAPAAVHGAVAIGQGAQAGAVAIGDRPRAGAVAVGHGGRAGVLVVAFGAAVFAFAVGRSAGRQFRPALFFQSVRYRTYHAKSTEWRICYV